MSDTPETDAAERMAFSQEHMVPTEFARRLERERDEAREALEFRRELYKVQQDRLESAMRERDEAREKNARLREIISRANRDYDEQIELFRSEVNKLRDIADRAIEMKEQEVWGRSALSFSWKQLRDELDQIKEGVK
jgi:flagellar biosynthesis GTPase FlhF